jgi:transcriptional regulator with XRE-family HTH domain
MSFGARLAEERRRLGLKQADFASLVGTDVARQSLYENDRRALRADYLARLAAAGVDVVYILTSRRSEGTRLGDDASALLSGYLALSPSLQEAVAGFLANLHSYVSQGQSGSAHSGRRDDRAESA